MSRKDLLKTLRQRGIDYVDEPPKNLQPKWLPYVANPAWLRIETWLEQANRLSPAEEKAENPPADALERLHFTNFEIRNYRMVNGEKLFRLLQSVREVLNRVVSQPRPAGIDHFEPDPLMLFFTALGAADLNHLHRCPVCGRFFLARRKDQLACSSKCSNAERQRRFRSNSPMYEQNRKRNRAAQLAREERKRRQIIEKGAKLRPR